MEKDQPNDVTPVVLVRNQELPFPNNAIRRGLYNFIDRHYIILDRKTDRRLIVPIDVMYEAGISIGLDGEEFDLDSAVETVRDQVIDPRLN
jgi:hypothetical protein